MPDTYTIKQKNADGSALIEFVFDDGTGDTKTVYDLSDPGIAQAAADSQAIIAAAAVLTADAPVVKIGVAQAIPALAIDAEPPVIGPLPPVRVQ